MCHLCEDYEWKYLGIIFYSIKVWGDQPYALQEIILMARKIFLIILRVQNTTKKI